MNTIDKLGREETKNSKNQNNDSRFNKNIQKIPTEPLHNNILGKN